MCKATFEIPSAETMLEIMISAIVVSRSKADPGPVAVIVHDTAFKSRTSQLRSLLDPLYNPDLELMEACMNVSPPGPRQLALFYEVCRNPTVFQSVGQEMKMAFHGCYFNFVSNYDSYVTVRISFLFY